MAEELIAACLRRIVLDAQATGQEVTVNSARQQAEDELSLDPGFLKTDKWKSKSKVIILSAVEEYAQQQEQHEPEKPVKRRRIASEDDEASELDAIPSIEEPDHEIQSDVSSLVDEPPQKQKRQAQQSAKKQSVQDHYDSNISEVIEKAPAKQKQKPKQHKEEENIEDDESDMSVLIDEPPAKKQRRSKEASAAVKSNSKKAAQIGDDPVRALQQQLSKCGIRKRWNLELADLSESQKISRLQRMLKDVGMTGRFSEAKARQIKEARELADEIEAANDFNETYGTGEPVISKGRARRSAADTGKSASPVRRASGFVDFGDSGDDDSD